MARTLPTPAPAPVPAQLIERAGELDLLALSLDHAPACGALLFFEGAAGVGKSSLLAEAARAAEARGALVMRARGGELEVNFPFGVARQLLEPRLDQPDPLERAALRGLAGAAGAVLTGAPGSEAASPQENFSGMLRLVRHLSERTPSLIAVDDVQWADRPSLELLLYLAQRLDDLPVVIACTRITGEDGPHATLVDRLASSPSAQVHRIEPLGEHGIRELLEAEGETDPRDAFVRAVLQESGGVPFLAKALLQSARAAGVRGSDPGRLRGLSSDAVARATCLRLERLPEGARALANAAAVLHNDATRMLAADVAGLDHFTALEAADVLRRAEIFDSRPELRFRHGIVRASLYEGLSPRARAGAHVQAARALAAADAPAERTAAHLLEAQRLGEDWALEALWEAGRSALSGGRLAFGIAYLRRALDEDPDPVQRSLLLAELGEAEAASGDPAGTTRLALAVEGAQTGAERAGTLERLGGALWLLGQEGAAAEAFERALDHAEASGDHAQAPSLRAGLLLAARLDADLRVRTIERLAPSLREPGFGRQRDPALLASVAFERALAGRRSTRVAELAERSLEGVLADLDSVPGPECYAACCALMWADSLATAEIALTMALESAHRRGNAAAASTISRFRAWAVFKRGRLAHASADALEASGPTGDGPSPGIPAAGTILAEVDMEQGRMDEAALGLHDPAQQTEWDDGPRHAFHLAARGRLHHLRGDPEAALAELLEAGRVMEALGVHNPAVLPWRSRAAIAAAATGDAARAMTLAGEEVSLARTFGAPGPLGVALRSAAIVGPASERLDRLREAVRCLERSPAALDRGRVLVDLGTELRRAGRRREAREALRSGMDLAQRCEATRLELRAREELTAAGARPRRQRVSGSEALTPRERQVAQLAARGVRNRDIAQRLFITPKTVEWHLGNAYRKLELHSRGSLIGALGEPESLERSA
ncbi:MAG: AAA family ATPase [Thermoleophilaceae bacterium]|nr:AAA family ATPase [Thermoleophilaceae bacterium]